MMNDIIIYDNYAEIILVNRNKDEVGRAIIDLEDIEKVKKYRWYMKNTGYVVSDIAGGKKKIRLHRLVMDILDKPEIIPDHKDRNKLNNRKTNLKLGSYLENNMNRDASKNNTTGIKGACWDRDVNKWRVSIKFKYKNVHIIHLFNKELAIKIRKEFDILFEKRSDNGIYNHLPISVVYEVKNEVLKKYLLEIKLDNIKNKIFIDDDNIFNTIKEYIPKDSKIWIHNDYLNLVKFIKNSYKSVNTTNDNKFDNFLLSQKPYMIDYIVCIPAMCIPTNSVYKYIRRCYSFKVSFAIFFRKEDIREDSVLSDMKGLTCIIHNNYIWYIRVL